ncbi:peptidoglycan binding protein [Bacillus sp. JCM 19047]|nr:peptidoglycan binding protein [Bacillus sp. JCM 19047]
MELKQDFIPQSNSNRPQTALRPTHITVHETANTSNGANAEMHARYVKGADAQARQVSWHVTVDDTQAIQHLPFNEVGWHAGANGNRQSIGIEICVNRDGNFPQARANAISLVRRLMNELSIGINSVVTHQHWTGKNCPANLLPSWNQFIADVRAGTSLNRHHRWRVVYFALLSTAYGFTIDRIGMHAIRRFQEMKCSPLPSN